MADAPRLARRANGDVRLDYSVGGIGRIRVWEPRGADALETTFREDGAVLLQATLETGKIEERVRETLAGSGDTVKVDYREVAFDGPARGARSTPW